MKSTNNIQLDAFPKDDKLWKVDWVADYKLDQSVQSESHVSVFLTQLKDIPNSNIDPLLPSNLTKIHRVEKIGVGHHNLVNIGSVWKNGTKHVQSIKYQKFTVDIDTSLASVIPFDANIPNKNIRVLPPHFYPIGSEAFQKIKSSPLISIPYNGDACGLLIPAVEIIRFYYLISSPLALAVYSGCFHKLTQTAPIFNQSTKQVTIRLNWGVPKTSASVIARYASSELTKQRVADIHNWLLKNGLNKTEELCPSSLFPFDGNTTLKINGIKVIGNDGVGRILCTNINNCTGPFLFDSLIIEQLRGEPKTDDFGGKPPSTSIPWPTYDSDPNDQLESDHEPSKKYMPLTLTQQEDRFELLKNKKIVTITIDKETPPKKKEIYDSGEKDKKISTADGTYGPSDTRKADVNIEQEKDGKKIIPDRLLAFLDMLKYLRAKSGLTAKTIAPKLPKKYENNDNYKPVKTLECLGENVVGCFKIGKKLNGWVDVFIEGKKRPRGLMIAHVVYQNKNWYVMDLERDGTKNNEFYSVLMLYKSDYSEINNDQLYDYISRCCIKKGWANILTEAANFVKKVTFNHGSILGDRVFEVMNQLDTKLSILD